MMKAEATADPRRNVALADRERVKQLERENAGDSQPLMSASRSNSILS